jgi:sugar transferase EpsL
MSAVLFPPGVPIRKRILDLCITIPGLLLLSPLLLLMVLVVRWRQGSPVFYRQARPGLHGRPFEIWKFRTMRELYDGQGRALSDAERLTDLGRWMRALSLDELPELWNVLRGEMSLVGPRPLLMQYLERYTPRQARRHEVLPGITGWAQVHGRNILDWETKFELDIWYVDHWSLGLDVKILFQTLWKVIRREGISQPGHATAEEFQGSQPDPPDG